MASEIRRGRRLPFVIIPLELLDSDASGTHLAVYAAIARYADNQGEAYPSRATIARHAHCSVDTVDRCLQQLIDLGFIEKQPRKDPSGDPTSNLYLVHEIANRQGVAAPMRPGVAAPMRPELDLPELEEDLGPAAPMRPGSRTDAATPKSPCPPDVKAKVQEALGGFR